MAFAGVTTVSMEVCISSDKHLARRFGDNHLIQEESSRFHSLGKKRRSTSGKANGITRHKIKTFFRNKHRPTKAAWKHWHATYWDLVNKTFLGKAKDERRSIFSFPRLRHRGECNNECVHIYIFTLRAAFRHLAGGAWKMTLFP